MTLTEVLMNEKTGLEFTDRINAHKVEGIIRFLSDDHVFIDAQGNEFKGKDRLNISCFFPIITSQPKISF
jgi:ketosteroid isomerase-like protein